MEMDQAGKNREKKSGVGRGVRWFEVDIFSQRGERELCSQGFIPVGYI